MRREESRPGGPRRPVLFSAQRCMELPIFSRLEFHATASKNNIQKKQWVSELPLYLFGGIPDFFSVSFRSGRFFPLALYFA
jgi:hypothetical protein